MPVQNIIEQIRRLFAQTASAEDRELVKEWLGSASDEEILSVLEEEWNSNEPFHRMGQPEADKILARILEEARPLNEKITTSPVRFLNPLQRYGVAAALLVAILGAAIFIWIRNNQTIKQPVIVAKNDIQAPLANRASIRLGNGRVIDISQMMPAFLLQKDVFRLESWAMTASLMKINPAKDDSTVTNVLVNPRGSRPISMRLPDGSRVWLNAASSLTYPSHFGKWKREVHLEGEAFFEVQHNASHPFIVITAHTAIEDLGTSFNVNSYPDDPAEAITLLSGIVRAGKTTLKPGQQALVTSSGTVQVNPDADVDAAVAWKNGLFRFNSNSVESVMRQAARWYDVDVDYQGTVQGTISGGISRQVPVSQFLEMLEKTGKLRFQIETKKIIVMPK